MNCPICGIPMIKEDRYYVCHCGGTKKRFLYLGVLPGVEEKKKKEKTKDYLIVSGREQDYYF